MPFHARTPKTIALSFAAASALVTGPHIALAQENWAELCDVDGNQQQIAACAAADEQEARSELDGAISRIAERYADQEEQLAAFSSAQARWEEQVKADVEAFLFVPEGQNPQFLYGSSYAMQHLDARTQLIRQRVEFLETNWLPDR